MADYSKKVKDLSSSKGLNGKLDVLDFSIDDADPEATLFLNEMKPLVISDITDTSNSVSWGLGYPRALRVSTSHNNISKVIQVISANAVPRNSPEDVIAQLNAAPIEPTIEIEMETFAALATRIFKEGFSGGRTLPDILALSNNADPKMKDTYSIALNKKSGTAYIVKGNFENIVNSILGFSDDSGVIAITSKEEAMKIVDQILINNNDKPNNQVYEFHVERFKESDNRNLDEGLYC